MPRIDPAKPSFNAGELSPRIAARTDFAKYAAGTETCLNLIPLAEGGLMRRPGSRYVAPVKTSSVRGRLKKFQFSTTQAYMLELGDHMMRFYRHQGQIVVLNTDAAITNGTFPAGITSWTSRSTGGGSIAHDATNFRLSLLPGGTAVTDIGWAEQSVACTTLNIEHVLQFRVYGAPGDKIEFQVGTASVGAQTLALLELSVGFHSIAFTPTVSPFFVQFRNKGSTQNKTLQIDDVVLLDNAPVELVTPYAEADIPTVEGPQSNDVLYLFHASYPTYKLERRGHTTWSLVEVAWQDGPFLDENTTATTLTFTAATGKGITLTASSIVGINGGVGFKASDVGRIVRLTAATLNWGWGVIVGFTSTLVVTVDIKRTVVSTSAQTKWRLGAWSVTTGFPQVANFFEQRLLPAGTTNQPQTFWASQTGDFENMAPDSPNTDGTTWAGTVQDDDALDYTISADDVNAIIWLSAGEDALSIGTTGGEWVPSSTGAVITPTDIAVRRQTTHGSSRVQPVRVDNVVLFLQRAGRKLREFAFAFESNGYRALDMTRLAAHITRGRITEMAFAEEPDSVIYAVRSDGVLLSMTYRREEDVVGWGRHILGGAFATGNAVVESIAVIPGSNGAGQVQDSTDRDEVWLMVKRTINGQTARYVELLERNFEGATNADEAGDDQQDAYFADAIITYDGVATSTISNLSHLEGQVVKVWADGAIHSDKTVTGAAITLDAPASVVQIGLGYTHRLKTLRIEGGNPAGTAVGKTKRIGGVTFVVLSTHTFSFGPDTNSLFMKDFRVVSDPMDAAAPLFTGEAYQEFDGGWATDTRIVVESDAPAPFLLLSLVPAVTVNPNP